MPTFTTDSGREYQVTGKYLIWVPENWEDEEPLPEVRLPLRVKMSVLRKVGATPETPEEMFAILEAIAPTQNTVLAEMDVNDFIEMFTTWLDQYNKLTGQSLGEVSASPGGLTIIEPPQNTTGEPDSV